MTFPLILSTPPPYRVLSMDGGGIFGLSMNILLEKLIQKSDSFLTEDEPLSMLAGTSAGAIMSLIMAKYDNPREAVENGEIEAFFTNGAVYSNRADPVASITSLMGLTSWAGSKDYKQVLRKHFGDMTLGDLKQRVLITSFDYHAKKQRGSEDPPHWRTKIFYNFPDREEDLSRSVCDVAYGSSTPAGYRTIVDGLTDGAIFAPNPSINALTKMVALSNRVDMTVESFDILRMASLFYYKIFECLCGGSTTLTSILDNGIHSLEQARFKIEKFPLDTIVPNTSPPSDSGSAEYFKAGIEMVEKGIVDLIHFSKELLHDPTNFDFLREMYVQFILLLRGGKHLASSTYDLDRFDGLEAATQIDFKDKAKQTFTKLIDVASAKTPDIVRIASTCDADEILELQEIFQRSISNYLSWDPDPKKTINDFSILSLGVCNQLPNYFTPWFDFGVPPFSMIPSNLAKQHIYSPFVTLPLDAPSTAVNFEMDQILGNQYRRLNPPVISFPTPPVLPALYMSRWKIYRDWIINSINHQMRNPRVDEEVDITIEWFNYIWNKNPSYQ